MCVKFKTGFLEAVERFIPTKMTKTKYSLPWIDVMIKRLMKRRQKLYLRARKSNDPDVKNHYKRFLEILQKVKSDAFYETARFQYFHVLERPLRSRFKLRSLGHLSNH